MNTGNRRIVQPTHQRSDTTTQNPRIPRSPLPVLPKPPANMGTTLSVTTVDVQSSPWYKGRKGSTWAVDKRPTNDIGIDDLVRLRIGALETGIGRISTIAELSRHWVTFLIMGNHGQFGLRTPSAWARLNDFARYTHENHYFLLDRAPPHSAFDGDPLFQDDTKNPYNRAPKRDTAMAARMALITNSHTRAGERMRHNWKEPGRGPE
ncbi:hypothetical protein FOMPIDRAFT_1047449 [Fomitopsis schrenkii]|uniref:Uncharacterized protein n=1 Tax=Fomitopsis schrenkii TaxID=2126942 RepID=S8FN77_FOMSC|nr:hypothetical protein FOMPIDRAFT_1047449 [Fomitopsis schrenkii]